MEIVSRTIRITSNADFKKIIEFSPKIRKQRTDITYIFLEPETTLILVVKYYSLKGEEATKGKKSETEYEEIPSHTKTIVITNTTQTDVAFELFAVSKWEK